MGDHNAIVGQVAATLLKPRGFRRKGKSRFWFKDLGWCAISAEFQPSSYCKGTYLNLALSWFWYAKDFWSFDFDVQRLDFAEYVSEEAFRILVCDMADAAVAYSKQVEPKLMTLDSAFRMVEAKVRGDWGNLHLGLLAALSRQEAKARQLLSLSVIHRTSIPWQLARNQYIDRVSQLIGKEEDLRQFLEAQIQQSRMNLRLPEVHGTILPKPE